MAAAILPSRAWSVVSGTSLEEKSCLGRFSLSSLRRPSPSMRYWDSGCPSLSLSTRRMSNLPSPLVSNQTYAVSRTTSSAISASSGSFGSRFFVK